MAIFGFGSNWDGNEMKTDFFNEEKIIIGWDKKRQKKKILLYMMMDLFRLKLHLLQ